MHNLKLKIDPEDKRHPLYHTWVNILMRCYVDFAVAFESYGGRGITVERRWHRFKAFAADVGDRPDGMTLDRLDNDKGYSRKNCRWASRSQQMLNRRPFKSGSTGESGVVRIADRFEARIHFDGVRYRLGRFDTVAEAKMARVKFRKLFDKDREAAVASIAEPMVWCTSTTKVRGISVHKGGGYVVRATRNGVRQYVGYFRTFEEAVDARREYDKG